MELQQAKQKFIQTWGSIGSDWGINKTMAQVHALLLIAPDPLSADEIMENLTISRGNVNMNVRALIDWGLVYRETVQGERKEFFRAEKDIYKVAKQIIKNRKQKELDPVLRLFSELKSVDTSSDTKEAKHFVMMIENLEDFVEDADNIVNKALTADENWIGKTLLKFMK